MPGHRLGYMPPTEKMDMPGDKIAALIKPTLQSDAIFYLDTGIFTTCTSGPLWELFCSRHILIPPGVYKELDPWLKKPIRNPDIRDRVIESISKQVAMEEDTVNSDPSPAVAQALDDLGIQIRSPGERYLKHGYEYYFSLLGLRKLIGCVIEAELQRKNQRPPTPDEFLAVAQSRHGERGYQLAKKGLDSKGLPNAFNDEQTVVMAVLTAILEGRETYIVTTDTDVPEQFIKLYTLIKEHYRAMLAAERYDDPSQMGFKEVSLADQPAHNHGWNAAAILELRLPESEFDVLPRRFQSVVVHCILLGRGEKTPTFSYCWFAMDTDAARVLQIKAATRGRSTDRFGDRNLTIRTGPLYAQEHEVIVSIGQEKQFPFGGWGKFGADDFNNVLNCCEEVTRVRPHHPHLLAIPAHLYSSDGELADEQRRHNPLSATLASGQEALLPLLDIRPDVPRVWLPVRLRPPIHVPGMPMNVMFPSRLGRKPGPQ
jgi:hypothetical protein